jgi:uncharacterized protein DUF4136
MARSVGSYYPCWISIQTKCGVVVERDLARKAMKNLIILIVLVIGAVPASAQNVKVTSDPNVDVTRYKTYAWAQPLPMGNPVVVGTVVEAVDQAMAERGLRKVETDPDVRISFWTASESDLHMVHGSVASPTGPSLSGAGSGAWPVTKGTLVISLVDAATQNSVWRATAKQTLENGPTGNPAKDAQTVQKPIRKAVAKMFKHFPRPK